MTDIIERKSVDRFRFLKYMYELTESQHSPFLDAKKVGVELGLSPDDTRRICDYLENEGLIKVTDESGNVVQITHQGVKEVEEVHRHPEHPTVHFPPHNIIINYGPLQQQHVSGTGNIANQSQTIEPQDIAQILKTLREILSRVDEIAPLELDRKRVETQAKSAIEQSNSPEPDSSIIRMLLSKLSSTLKTIGTPLAVEFLKKLLGFK